MEARLSLDCVSLWIGDSIGAVERACLRSVLRQGHSFVLYCYAVPAGVPAGVELRDAAEILPPGRIVRHRGGSVSLFANLFRYELMRRGLGTWLDCDVYLLKPLDRSSDHLFGWQDEQLIGSAVLRLPAESPVLPPLIEAFGQESVIPWLPWRARLAGRWQLLTKGRIDLGRLPWGSCGPLALTWLARAHGLEPQAMPTDVFYPAPHPQARWILEPGRTLEEVATPRTVSIHLWNELIRPFKEAPAPPGSVLARLKAEGRE